MKTTGASIMRTIALFYKVTEHFPVRIFFGLVIFQSRGLCNVFKPVSNRTITFLIDKIVSHNILDFICGIIRFSAFIYLKLYAKIWDCVTVIVTPKDRVFAVMCMIATNTAITATMVFYTVITKIVAVNLCKFVIRVNVAAIITIMIFTTYAAIANPIIVSIIATITFAFKNLTTTMTSIRHFVYLQILCLFVSMFRLYHT